jgi:hypothetical protein
LKQNHGRFKLLQSLLLQWQLVILDDPCIFELKEHHYTPSESISLICFTELELNTSRFRTAHS